MARKTQEVQDQQPEGGGSYVRDPNTGGLTLVERTEEPSPETDSTIPFDESQE